MDRRSFFKTVAGAAATAAIAELPVLGEDTVPMKVFTIGSLDGDSGEEIKQVPRRWSAELTQSMRDMFVHRKTKATVEAVEYQAIYGCSLLEGFAWRAWYQQQMLNAAHEIRISRSGIPAHLLLDNEGSYASSKLSADHFRTSIAGGYPGYRAIINSF